MSDRHPSSPPLKVVHALFALDVGGLERVVLNLVRHGTDRGQEVSVLCLNGRGVQAPQAEALGARVRSADKPPGLSYRVVARLASILEELKPDVVHSHHVGVLLYLGPAARRAGAPLLVHTEHNNYIRKQASQLGGRLRTVLRGRVAGRHVRRFFCVSGDVASAVREYRVFPPEKTFVVSNGIDLSPFDAADGRAVTRAAMNIVPDAPVIGTVGRLDEVKRQDLLIRAFGRVREKVPAARLVLVGDGPSADELKRLTGELRLSDVVHFAGYQSKPVPYLQAFDLFASTSRIEGLPLAVLEAWAAGLPVVASRVGGLPEVVEEGRNGMLFDFGDDARLDAVLLKLLGDEPLRRRMGQAGRQRVEAEFSVARMGADYERHYRELLGPAFAAAGADDDGRVRAVSATQNTARGARVA